jgi:hypothetical protein
MDKNYNKMMRQSFRMSGMSEQSIDALLAMQADAIKNYDSSAFRSQMEAFADTAGSGDIDDILGKNESLFEFVEKPSINESYRWAVACGADFIHLRGDIINDLPTGMDRDICVELLNDQWGISRKEDFSAMAKSLKGGRHAAVYARLASGGSAGDFAEEAKNIKEAEKLFKSDGLTDGGVPNMMGWDLGRLVNLSRLAFDAGILTRSAALKQLREAALLVKKEYASWKELSTGYQFGRAVWGGLEDYAELKEGMEELLTEKDSPWVTLPFELALKFKD